MQSHQLVCEIQAEAMTRYFLACPGTMETFKDVGLRLGRNSFSSICDVKIDMVLVRLRPDPNRTIPPIVLARVVEQVLHNQRREAAVSGDLQIGWNIIFHPQIS